MDAEAMFQPRVGFEAAADAVHDIFMRGRGIDPERELQLHMEHMLKSLGRVLESSEREDLESMLWLRGKLRCQNLSRELPHIV